ncbi:MAG: PDZ domain-containing protein [Planctomycetaceae bacterium]
MLLNPLFPPAKQQIILGLAIFLTLASSVRASDSPGEIDELGQLVQQAVRKVDPAVVRIRPIGSEQNTDGGKINTAASTGVVISSDGQIVTSAFSVEGNPQAILVETIDGKRVPAEIVATDFVRKLVLLKAGQGDWTAFQSTAGSTTTTATTAIADPIIGQWTIAVGRFYDTESSNISVGILSAVNRVHSMAIQTDAKISPLNYGGPLINLDGDVLGLLVPLSPRSSDGVEAGVEWYDSGIGFAIPMKDVLDSANRLRAGKNLKSGKLGIAITAPGAYSDDVRVQSLHPGGPASEAGLRTGDRIVMVNGLLVDRSATLESAVARSYAEDRMQLQIERDGEKMDVNLILAERLPVVQPGYLGVMPLADFRTGGNAAAEENEPVIPAPRRGPSKSKDPENQEEEDLLANQPNGLIVCVESDSPAAKAGLPAVVRIESIDGVDISSAGGLRRELFKHPPGSKVVIGWSETRYSSSATDTDDEKPLQTTEVVTGDFPAEIPSYDSKVLALVRGATNSTSSELLDIVESVSVPQRKDIPIGEDGHVIVFHPSGKSTVSDESDPGPGLIVLLSSGNQPEEQVLRSWQSVIHSHHLAVAVPRNPDGTRLTQEDIRLIVLGAIQTARELEIDSLRLVVAAESSEADLARNLIYSMNSPFRGALMLDGWISPTAENSVDSQLGRSVLQLEIPSDRQSQVLRTTSIRVMQESGLRVFSLPAAQAADVSPESSRRIAANWSLFMKSM